MSKLIQKTSAIILLFLMAGIVLPETFDMLTNAQCKAKLGASLDEETKTNICKGQELRSLGANKCTGRLKNGRCQPQDSEGLSTVAHTSKAPPAGLWTEGTLTSIIPAGTHNSGGVLAGSNYRAYLSNDKVKISQKSGANWKAVCTIPSSSSSCSIGPNPTRTFTPTLTNLNIVIRSVTPARCLNYYNAHCLQWTQTTSSTSIQNHSWKD